MANPQKIKAEVKGIKSYGRQVYKVDFVTDKKFPRFKAGQFLHLTLDDFDPTTGFWPESRVFSIASSSDDRKQVSIVYSVKGSYTKKMETELQTGKEIWLKAPYGEFIIPNHIHDGETAVLIAGGTGVSPFIPYLIQFGDSNNIQLNYGLRHRELMIFEKELEKICEYNNFQLNLYLEDTSGNSDEKINAHEMEGLLSIESILSNVEDINRPVFFISGPPKMIETFKQQLIDKDFKSEKIIIDEWG